MDRQGQILRGASSIIFHHLWRDRCCCSVMEAMWLCLLIIDCSCSWERAWILLSDLKLLKWNPNITFASYTYWIWTVIHVVTGSLKTSTGLCNIFFCLNLETKIESNQTNSRESIINTDIFHRPGGSGCTYLDDSVLEAPQSFKKDGVLRGVDENDEHKTHANTAK